jgi:MFS superfamily sulfate permease-like transporter
MTDAIMQVVLKCVVAAMVIFVPAYLALVYRVFPSRPLVVVFVAALVLLVRHGASMFVSEYDAMDTTPSGMVLFMPNQAHTWLACLELTARLALIYGLVGIWRQPMKARADASLRPPQAGSPGGV